MSIGDLTTYGNKGNNFPWQLKMLQGMQCVCDQLKEINIDTDDLEQLLADLIVELQNGIDVTIVNPLGQQIMDDSISVTVASDQTGIARTPGIIRPTGSGNVNTAAATFYSVSVANVGSADGSVLGGTNNIKPGEVLNFSGDALNNYFTSFAYNAIGTEFIIIYVS
jgi:hypothetical protein